MFSASAVSSKAKASKEVDHIGVFGSGKDLASSMG